jgi:hypothetical protein
VNKKINKKNKKPDTLEAFVMASIRNLDLFCSSPWFIMSITWDRNISLVWKSGGKETITWH